MSLKAFHKFFIAAAIFLCAWLAKAEYEVYAHRNVKESMYTCIVMGGLAVALTVYLIWFLWKSRKWPTD